MKNIVLIGSGNVATHLGLCLHRKNYTIKQVWSQKLRNANILAKKLNSISTDDLNNITDADVYIVAVKDDAVESVIERLEVNNIVHTSGSIGLEVFKKKPLNHGVLYPLQTFNKDVNLELSNTPICIEVNNKTFEKKMTSLANNLSEKVIKINTEQRKRLHIAAVFSCNFTNYLFSISEEILTKGNSEFNLLLPIIKQTVEKLNKNKPSAVQTGPAKRGDIKVIQNHLNSLKDKQTREIYRLISKAIMNKSE